MLSDLLKSIWIYFRAARLLTDLRSWMLALIPALLLLLVSGIYIYFAIEYSSEFGKWLLDYYPFAQGEEVVTFITSFLSVLILIVLYYLLLKYLMLIIGAPFMSPLSERVEQKIAKSPIEISISPAQFAKDIWRAIRMNIRNLLRETGITLLLLLLSFFPVFSVISPFLIFLVAAYYAGFGNMDFAMERHFSYKESIAFVRENRGLAIGNGIVFLILFSIPVLGIFIAMPFATSAATVSVVRRKERKELGKAEENL